MIEQLCKKVKKFYEKFFEFNKFIIKFFLKVILIFKLELKYVIKFIAYTNKKCNGKSWQSFFRKCIKIS